MAILSIPKCVGGASIATATARATTYEGIDMTDPDQAELTRRTFVKTVAYVTPVVMTLSAAPALASQASPRPKGNNGVGNGEDPQPPGNPPINDGPGTSPGDPGNRNGNGPG